MSELNRMEEPQKEKGELFIKRLDAGEQIEVVCLSVKPEGFLTHWQPAHGNRKGYSLPCTKPIEECEGHVRRLGTRWRGYIHCFELHKGKPLFMEITPETLQNLRCLLGEATIYRGLVFGFKRMNGKNTRIITTLLAEWARRSHAPLTEPLSVEPMLRKLWQMSRENRPSEGGSNVQA